MINVGIIGCGKIAQTRHIPEYLANENVKIVGVYDINTDRAKSIAKELNAKSFDSYQALIDDENIHAVSVCSSNDTHAEITIKALKANKNVLCEKPMATTLNDCENMVKEAKNSGKILMIGQNQRLAKAHIEAKKIIESNLLGDILTFRTTFGHGGPETWSIDSGKNTWFFDKNKAFMGAMADLGIHKLDLLQFLFDKAPTKVYANLTTLDKVDGDNNKISVDDNAMAIINFENIVGTLTASWTHYGKEDNSTIIYGTKGILKIYDSQDKPLVLIDKSGKESTFEVENIQTNDNQTSSGIIDLFINAIKNHLESPISGESVLKAMRGVFACQLSSRMGKAIIIE